MPDSAWQFFPLHFVCLVVVVFFFKKFRVSNDVYVYKMSAYL